MSAAVLLGGLGTISPAYAEGTETAAVPVASGQASAPSRVENLRAVLDDGTLTVTWDPATPNGTPITGYTVAVRPGTRTVELGPEARSATFTGLATETRYTIYVVATSAVNDASEIPPGTEEIAPVRAPGIPSLHLVTRGGTSVKMTWSPFVERGAPVTGYRVTGLPSGPVNLGPEAREISSDGLEWGETYRLALTALSDAGASEPITYVVNMPVLRPTRVQGLDARVRARRVVVTWDPARERGAAITGYAVVLRGTTENGRTVTRRKVVGPDATRAAFGKLPRNSQFRFAVRALSSLG
ncbi:fibronectin type III domain-containing protein [Nocardioidaceae bacterium]|nr:fibronectin type III domain-containing protein [Nocardioidaceae bacterium]